MANNGGGAYSLLGIKEIKQEVIQKRGLKDRIGPVFLESRAM